MKSTRLLPLIFLLLPLGTAAESYRQPLIVDWGHDWGGGWYRQSPAQNQNSVWRPLAEVDLNGNGDLSDDFIGGWEYDLERPLSPTNAIYDQTYPSARFFGAAVVGVTDIPLDDQGKRLRVKAPTEGHINQNHELRDDWNLMCFPVRKREPEVSRYNGALLVYWKKEDFLNGGDRHRVSLDADSVIGVFISRYWGGIHWGRWVIQDAEGFFISEATFAGQTQPFDLTDDNPGNGARNPVVRVTHAIDPVATRWAPYRPVPPHEVFFDPASAVFAPRTFDDVRAVGFLAQRDLSTGRPVAGGLWDLPHGVGEPIALKFNAVQVRGRVHRQPFISEYLPLRLIPAEVEPTLVVSVSPVSLAQWLWVTRWAVTNQRARNFTPAYAHLELDGYSFDRDGAPAGLEVGSAAQFSLSAPVTEISWHDVALWCNALSELEGLEPAYYVDEAFERPLHRLFDRAKLEERESRPAVYWKRDAGGYRLPLPEEISAIAPDGDPVWLFAWDSAQARVTPEEARGFRVYAGPAAAAKSEIGFRAVRNGPGRAALVAKPLSSRPIVDFSTPAPDPVPLRKMVEEGLQWVRLPGTGHLPVNEQMERQHPAAAAYDLLFCRTEMPYEVWTGVRQWAEAAGGYRFNHRGDAGSLRHLKAELADARRHAREPVTQITWMDAVVWCNALSELLGLDPVYRHPVSGEPLRDAGTHRVDSYAPYAYANTGRYPERPLDTAAVIAIKADTDRNGFRLPAFTEMEGVHEPAHAEMQAWMDGNAGGKTQAAGTREANRFGLFDVEGNVREWCYGGDSLFGQNQFGTCFEDAPGLVPHSMTRRESPFVGRPTVGFRPVRRP